MKLDVRQYSRKLAPFLGWSMNGIRPSEKLAEPAIHCRLPALALLAGHVAAGQQGHVLQGPKGWNPDHCLIENIEPSHGPCEVEMTDHKCLQGACFASTHPYAMNHSTSKKSH